MTNSDIQHAPEEENGTLNVEVDTSPQPDDAEYDINEVVIEEDSPQQDSQVEHETDENQEKPLDTRQINKMSALEKERNEAAIRAKDAEFKRRLALLEYNPSALDNEFRDNPNEFESFRKLYSERIGKNLPSHAEVYNQPNNYAVGGKVNNHTLSETDVDKIVETKIETREAIQKLIGEIPQADPKNMKSVEEYQQAERMLQEALDKTTITMKYRQDISLSDALVMNYKTLPEFQENAINRARLEGEVLGKAKAYGQNVGVGSGLSAGQNPSVKKTTVKMTTAQKQKYEELKRRNPKLADRFAMNIRNMSR